MRRPGGLAAVWASADDAVPVACRNLGSQKADFRAAADCPFLGLGSFGTWTYAAVPGEKRTPCWRGLERLIGRVVVF